jgi:iron complex transport system permease protein
LKKRLFLYLKSGGSTLDKKLLRLCAVLLLTLAVLALLNAVCGLIPVSLSHLLMGTLSAREQAVIYFIRMPRFVFGAVAGAALSLSGAVLQGVFGNPLADPGILGVSGGACLGAVLALLSGLCLQFAFLLPLGAFAGALAAIFAVNLLGRSHGERGGDTVLLLGGVAIGLFCGALTSGLLSFAPPQIMQQYFFWTLGTLSGSSWRQLPLLPFMGIFMIILMLLGRPLNLLSLGEEQALAAGLDVFVWRRRILLLVSFLTALAVCLVGNISFVGLIVPHLTRRFTGPDHRRLLPASAAMGAVVLVACDFAGRVLFPFGELRTGIVTALLGAPYFLFLLRRH